jgi:Glycosyl hydrolases family 18
MWRQRETQRRRPLAKRRDPADAVDTVGLLESISLTAVYTDLTPPQSAPTTTAGDVLSTFSSRAALPPVEVGSTVLDARERRLGLQEGVPVRKLAIGAGALTLLIGCLAAGLTLGSGGSPPAHVRVAISTAADRLAMSQPPVHLAPATAAPAPVPPQVALAAPTAAHEVFGYAPYWSLPQASQFPVSDFSTIAYFSVDVNPDGTVDTSGPGWAGYESQDLTNLVNAAHQAGDRVVLTATDFSNSSLNTLTHDPTAGETLGRQLTKLVKDKNLDGVNLDLEGTGNGDQAGLDHLVSQVDFILHASDPHYQLTMATYASSAGDSSGFYDIAGLSKWVDAFFVMAYDVNQGPGQGNGNAGDDAAYISQYVAAAGASKVILGLPLFGYDEPTSGPGLGSAATGGSQTVTDAQAVASGPTYWDAATDTAWTSYQAGAQWHQVFFDNANTLADKVQLAASAHLLGVGAWALGMEGTDDSVLSVLSGGTSPLRTPPVGPVASASTVTPGFQATGNSGSTATTTTQPTHKHKSATASTTSTTAVTHAPKASTTTTTRAPKATTTTTTTTTTSPKQSTTTSSTTGETGTTSASSTTTTGPLP